MPALIQLGPLDANTPGSDFRPIAPVASTLEVVDHSNAEARPGC